MDSFINSLSSFLKEPTASQTKAFKMLQDIGFPDTKSENYKYSPMARVIEKNVDFDLSNEIDLKKVDLSYFDIQNRLVTLNGKFSDTLSSVNDLIVKTKEVSEGNHDPFSLMNTVFAPEEIEVSIKGADKVVLFIQHTASNALNVPRIKFHLKKGQSITIIEKSSHLTTFKSFTNTYTSFEIEENAVVNHTKIQDFEMHQLVHETVVANVHKNGQFSSSVFSFGGEMVRNNLTISLSGENAQSYMNGLYMLSGKSHVDNNTTVNHLFPNTYSNQLYKGVLEDQSKGVFNGKILVQQKAQKTNAFQSNNNILLSDSATLHSKPQLEIWADDVKCSHGCTSGQLDEEAIFYLQSRGLSKKIAKSLLLESFAYNTLNLIPEEIAKEEIKKLIRGKLR